MTIEERATEIVRLANADVATLRAEGFCTIADIHKRIEALMERPVWTHELARPEWLAEELRTGRRASMEEIIGKVQRINPDAQVIVVAEDPS